MAASKPEVKWQGHPIRVTAALVSRFLWQTASIDVFVDDERILRTGGQLKLVGSVESSFVHGGANHRAKLAWGLAVLPWFPYTLSVDGSEISSGRVYVQRWYIGLGVIAVAATALSYLAAKVMLWSMLGT